MVPLVSVARRRHSTCLYRIIKVGWLDSAGSTIVGILAVAAIVLTFHQAAALRRAQPLIRIDAAYPVHPVRR